MTGQVTNVQTREPIPDVTVSVVGGAGIARTDTRGQFRLTIPPGVQTIAARSIGYKRATQTVQPGESLVNFALERDVLQLEGVVVTGVATTLDRRNATTAIAQVQASDLVRAPAASLESALQGKVVGATINMNSGAPGGGGQIQIRGATSILAQGDPLYVIDGVIVSNISRSSGLNSVTGASNRRANFGSTQDNVVNRLADLNPNEIESIEVLKSAAATAIYGSRATNGVVVIRTKRGQAGAPRFTLTQRVGTQEPLRLLGSRQYNTVEDALKGVSSAADSATVRQIVGTGPVQRQDYQKQLYSNTSPSYETIISASGGSDATRYFVGGTYKKEEGAQINTGARLQTLRINLDQDIGEKVSVSVGANVTRNTLNRGLSNNDNTGTSPMYLFGYIPAILDLRQRDESGNFVVQPFNGGGANTSNPFQTLEFLKSTEDVTRQLGSINATYTPIETGVNRLAINGLFGFDRFTQSGDIYAPPFLQFEPGDGLPGTAVQSTIRGNNVNASLNAIYTFSPISLPFTSTTSAGLVYEEQGDHALYQRGQGLLPGVPNTATAGQQDFAENRLLFRDQAIYVNQEVLAFSDRLSLSAGVRADRSSANGDREKYYVFPRASASYIFQDLLPRVDEIKLRAGYGETGNRPRYGDRDVLLASGGVLGGRTTLIRNGTVGNPDIRPETLQEYEFGFDVSALAQRASGEFTFYNRTINDFLLNPSVAPSSGYNNLVINAGEFQVRGYEAAVNFIPVRSGNFDWTSRIAYQSNVQKITDLPSNVPPFPAAGSFGAAYGRNYIINNSKVSSIWGNAPVELDASGTPVRILPMGYYLQPQAGITVVARDTIIGDANPDFQMGFTNTFSMGRINLSFLVDWRQGGDIANMTNNLWDEGLQSRDFDDPSPIAGVPLGEYRYGSWNSGRDTRVYIQDGTYVKLREVAIGYDVSTELVNRLVPQVTSMRVQLLGRNLAMWTDYWGLDPEFNNFGNTNLNRFIDLAPYPPTRQFFLSFDLGF